MQAQWRDTTYYTAGETERKPRRFEYIAGPFVLTVHRHINDPNWFLTTSIDGEVDPQTLKTTNIDRAQWAAIDIFRQRLMKVLDALPVAPGIEGKL